MIRRYANTPQQPAYWDLGGQGSQKSLPLSAVVAALLASVDGEKGAGEPRALP